MPYKHLLGLNIATFTQEFEVSRVPVWLPTLPFILRHTAPHLRHRVWFVFMKSKGHYSFSTNGWFLLYSEYMEFLIVGGFYFIFQIVYLINLGDLCRRSPHFIRTHPPTTKGSKWHLTPKPHGLGCPSSSSY